MDLDADTTGAVGGYGVTFVKPLDKEFECPELDNVKEHKKINNVKENKKTLELEVKCKNKLDVPSDHDCLGCTDASHTGRLCTWTGELRLYKEHLKECDYENVPCENDCGMNMQRWVLADHLRLCCVL
jgi:hypothetical protein